jgi:hypothetical protein
MNSKRGGIVGLLGVLLIIAAGCSDKNNVPSGILSQEKMAGVLWDMIQADQYSTLYLAKDSAKTNTKMETLRLYEEVFRLHQVSREEFRKSYQYYLDHPALNQVLFDSLEAKGIRLRTEGYSRPAPFRPIPQVPVPSQISPSKGAPSQISPSKGAPAHGPAPSMPAPSIPAPGHIPAFPFRPSAAPVKKFRPSRLNARDSATKSILHPGILHPVKKDSARRPA